MKNYILSFLMLLILSTSCKKDKDADLSRTDLLTDKKWKLTAETATSGNTTYDFYANEDACTQDDLIIFSKDNTFILDEGATKCDPADPQVFGSGTWAFTNNETKILITVPGLGSNEGDIVELTSNRLVTRASEVNNGVTYTVTSTYAAQ